jgi:hypothetical protein
MVGGPNPHMGAYRCLSPQQAFVPVRIVLVRASHSRRPAAGVAALLAPSQRLPYGFPMSLAGEPARRDIVTEWRTRNSTRRRVLWLVGAGFALPAKVRLPWDATIGAAR